jgi:hypothetical protein
LAGNTIFLSHSFLNSHFDGHFLIWEIDLIWLTGGITRGFNLVQYFAIIALVNGLFYAGNKISLFPTTHPWEYLIFQEW